MATIQVRKFPDDIYARIANAAALAERSVEGEVRYALARVYPESQPAPAPVLSQREAWQKAAGERIQWLFDRLRQDGWFAYGEASDPVSLAARIDEASPAALLDCLDGVSGPSFEMAARMERALGCRAEWIMSGRATPFRFDDLTSDYHAFFQSLLDDAGRLKPDSALHFVRICATDHHDGTLLVLARSDTKWQARYERTRFYLKDGMGGGGRGNLLRFLTYVKTRLSHVPIESWLYRHPDRSDPELGFHHPEHYIQHLSLTSKTDWLFRLLNGDSPKGFTLSFGYELDRLRELPYGQEENRPAPAEVDGAEGQHAAGNDAPSS